MKKANRVNNTNLKRGYYDPDALLKRINEEIEGEDGLSKYRETLKTCKELFKYIKDLEKTKKDLDEQINLSKEIAQDFKDMLTMIYNDILTDKERETLKQERQKKLLKKENG